MSYVSPSPIFREGWILNTLLKIEEYFISLLFAVITTAVVLEVVFRYFLFYSLAWTEDLSMFLFIWFVGVGASATLANRADIRVTVIVERLPKKIKLVVELVGLVLWGILLFAVMRYAWNMAHLLFKMRSATIILEIPLGLIYLGVVIGFFLALLKLVLIFYRRISGAEDPFLKTGQRSQ